MNRKNWIHDKAIELVNGGVVEVDSHRVIMSQGFNVIGVCFDCDLDSICHQGTTIYDLCSECDMITGVDCFLVLVDKK